MDIKKEAIAVTCIIPTYKRVVFAHEAVQTLKQSLLQSIINWKCYVVVDGVLSSFKVLRSLQDKHVRVLYNKENIGYWTSLNRCLRFVRTDLVAFLADDCRFTELWLDKAVECYYKNFKDGRGLLAFNDLHMKDEHAPHGLVSQSLLLLIYGKKQFPKYRHYFGDSELNQRARLLNRFGYCDEAIVEHLHPIIGKREYDETDDHANIFWDQDEQLYNSRQWVLK